MPANMQNKAPLFSIITVCLNEPGLEKTCKSIVEQSFQDFEWIVIDGGSDQKTLDIFEKYKYRMNYFVSEKDDGIYDAMNKGIKKATGEWLNFMNAGDCFSSRGILSKMDESISNNSDCDIFYGDHIEEFRSDDIQINEPQENEINKLFFINTMIHHQALFYKKYLFIKFGLYNISYKIYSDRIHLMNLVQKGIVFKHIKYIINRCDVNGVSKNKLKTDIERQRFVKEFYTDEEILKARRKNPKLVVKNISNRLRQQIEHRKNITKK